MPRLTQQKQTLETRTEVTQSTHLEQRISTQLEMLHGSVQNLTMKLFGDPTIESAHGRLPRLEKATDEHDERISKLESLNISEADERLTKLEEQQIRYAAIIGTLATTASFVGWLFRHA